LSQVFRSQLRATIRTHDETLERKGQAGVVGANQWRTNPVPFDKKLRKKKKYKKAGKAVGWTASLGRDNPDHIVWEQFNKLCRGEELRSPGETRDLKCSQLHYHNPYLRCQAECLVSA
jgi:hypothetical protein